MPNIFSALPASLPHEQFDELAQGSGTLIQRIVSLGHVSPPDDWYDQDQTEWVIVLKGEAKLLFEGDGEPIHMKPGDYVLIPAGRRHRVEWTSADVPTVWLAVFFDETPGD